MVKVAEIDANVETGAVCKSVVGPESGGLALVCEMLRDAFFAGKLPAISSLPCLYARVVVTLRKHEGRCVEALCVVWDGCRSREAVPLHVKVLFGVWCEKTTAPSIEMSPCVYARAAVALRKREVRCVEAVYVGWDGCRSLEAVPLHMKVLSGVWCEKNDGPMCRDEPVCIRQGCNLAQTRS